MIGDAGGMAYAAKMEERRRYAELDGYRGIAALMIVAYHCYLLSGRQWEDNTQRYAGQPIHLVLRNLNAGVAFFFVLSGFVIFLPFARAAITATTPPERRAFLTRRAARILPLYLVATLTVWLLGLSRGEVGVRSLLINLTLTTNVFNASAVLGPAWSLCHEMTFYLALALVGPWLCRIAALLGTRDERATLLLLVIALIVMLSEAYKVLVMLTPLSPLTRNWAALQPPATVDQFGIGMALAIAAARYGGQLPVRSAWGLRGASGALLFLACSARMASDVVDTSRPGVLFFGSLCALAFGLLLASTVLTIAPGRLARCVAHPILTRLGLISYGVYLLHEEPFLEALGRRGVTPLLDPAQFTFNTVVIGVLAILAATATYRLIERPCLRLVQRVAAPHAVVSMPDRAKRRRGKIESIVTR